MIQDDLDVLQCQIPVSSWAYRNILSPVSLWLVSLIKGVRRLKVLKRQSFLMNDHHAKCHLQCGSPHRPVIDPYSSTMTWASIDVGIDDPNGLDLTFPAKICISSPPRNTSSQPFGLFSLASWVPRFCHFYTTSRYFKNQRVVLVCQGIFISISWKAMDDGHTMRFGTNARFMRPYNTYDITKSMSS